jgi:hypothetical protein
MRYAGGTLSVLRGVMMKRIAVFRGMVARVLMTALLFTPGFVCGLDNEDFDKYVSVSVQPCVNWLVFSGPCLDYTIKPSVFTTVELSPEYRKFLKFFFDFDINTNDNSEGEAVWKGVPVPGQPNT